MPKVPPSHLEARRRGILAAAQRCISRSGIRRTTMRDICRAANLSPGAVYRYFDSKEAIVAALAAGRQKQIAAFFRRLARETRGRPDAARLTTALAELVRSLEMEAAQEGIRLDLRLWSEALHTTAVRKTVASGLDEIVDELTATLPQPLGTEPEALPRLLIALLQGLALQKALDPSVDLETLAEALLALRP